MRLTLTMTALVLGLAACRTAPSDATLRQRLVGTWVADWDPSRVVENRPDGTCTSCFTWELTNTARYTGTWQVKRGFIIATMRNALTTNDPVEFETNRVVSVTEQELVVLSHHGGTNRLVLHRQ